MFKNPNPRRNDRKPGGRRPKYGRDTYNSDKLKTEKEKSKTVNAEAIERSKLNNKIISKMLFSSPSGKYIELQDNLSIYFTLTPSKPLIDCKYIRLLETVETKDELSNKRNTYFTRGCMYNKKEGEIPEPCIISNEKINSGGCVGNKFQSSSIEFLIASGGTQNIDGFEKEFKIMFVNKKLEFIKLEFIDNPDPLKNNALFTLYNDVKGGVIKTPTIPKPGNTLFHTLFSGEVDVEIETLTGDSVSGTVKGYEFTPGGHPSLNVWSGETLRIVPLYNVGIINVKDYKNNDVLSKRAIDLTLLGHIVIPHRGNNTIYDYCKRNKNGKEQDIKLDSTMIPFDQHDKHDVEVKAIMRN